MKLVNQTCSRLKSHFNSVFSIATVNSSYFSNLKNKACLQFSLLKSSSVGISKASLFSVMSENALYVGTSVRGLTKEIEIPVPWGIIAGKVYGESGNPPVLCIHGWLDNCNTFDSLIPLLPKDKFYLFIDLPGHGRSSPIPIGSFYTSFDYIALVERLSNYFSWSSFSLMSHSLGGNVSAVYAGTFPEKVDKLVLLDAAGVYIVREGYEAAMLRSSIESYAKFEKELGRPLPSYGYEVAREKLLRANSSLTGQFADVLLERGTAQQEDGTFRFVRDFRHNFRNPTGINLTTGIRFMRNVRAETLHVIAKDGPFKHISDQYKDILTKVFTDGFKSCEFHQRVDVDGMHHVHLCKPENVIQSISDMLNRPPRPGLGVTSETTSSL